MGGVDKLLLEIDGVPLLIRTCRIAAATGQPVFAAIPGPWHPRYKALRNETVTCFDIPEAKEGIGGTLRGAVRRLPPCEAFMILLADLPKLETPDILSIIDVYLEAPDPSIVRAATFEGKPGHPILFPSRYRKKFEELSGDDGAKSVIEQTKTLPKLVRLKNDRALHDIDTPEDWENWEKSRAS